MKIVLISFFLLSFLFPLHAEELAIRPGYYDVDGIINTGGQKINIKELQKMTGQEEDSHVCILAEDISNKNYIKQLQVSSDCTFKETSSTKTELKGVMQCPQGGKTTIHVAVNGSNFVYNLKAEATKVTPATEMQSTAKFLSEKCPDEAVKKRQGQIEREKTAPKSPRSGS